MADAVAQLGELVEPLNERLLVRKPRVKQRGERPARQRILELAQIGVLELANKRRVVVGVERRVLV